MEEKGRAGEAEYGDVHAVFLLSVTGLDLGAKQRRR